MNNELEALRARVTELKQINSNIIDRQRARNVSDVAVILDINPEVVRRLFRRGHLKGYKTQPGPKARWYTTLAEIERFRETK